MYSHGLPFPQRAELSDGGVSASILQSVSARRAEIRTSRARRRVRGRRAGVEPGGRRSRQAARQRVAHRRALRIRCSRQLRARLLARRTAREEDLVLYEDAVNQHLYHRYYPRFFERSFGQEMRTRGVARWSFYREFLADWRHFCDLDGLTFPSRHEPAHTFACFRQIQRAFEQIFRDIIGGSMPAARLRAAVWQSIFTHDMRRYRRTLFARMGEFATLITGPSGTGKELVARAIAQSRYVPFDERQAALRRRRRGAVSRSTSRRCRRRWWSPNCSAIAADRSPARWAIAKAGSKPARRSGPYSSTSWATWIRRSR